MASHVGLNAIAIHDELLSAMPDGARHDSDTCGFCTADRAIQLNPHASVPSGDQPSDASANQHPTPEGGTPETMSDNTTISTETHAALLEKAVKDATSATEKALERKIEEASELTAKNTKLEADKAALTTDNERLNKELDTAQVSLKTATDEVASLKADNASKDEAAIKAELATKRAEQVSNLNLFPKEYVTEKAAKWADVSEADWAERVEEWTKAKPATTADGKSADTASAMNGTGGDLTKDVDTAGAKQPSYRRAALGLNSVS